MLLIYELLLLLLLLALKYLYSATAVAVVVAVAVFALDTQLHHLRSSNAYAFSTTKPFGLYGPWGCCCSCCCWRQVGPRLTNSSICNSAAQPIASGAHNLGVVFTSEAQRCLSHYVDGACFGGCCLLLGCGLLNLRTLLCCSLMYIHMPIVAVVELNVFLLLCICIAISNLPA